MELDKNIERSMANRRQKRIYAFYSGLLLAAFLSSLGMDLFAMKDCPGAQICTCNHGSSREKHRHDIPEVSNRKYRITCEMAQPGERHFCSCKKHNSKARNFTSLVILEQPAKYFTLLPARISTDRFIELESFPRSGLSTKPWKPPKR